MRKDLKKEHKRAKSNRDLKTRFKNIKDGKFVQGSKSRSRQKLGYFGGEGSYRRMLRDKSFSKR